MDNSRFYVGKLCKKGHEYRDTGGSMRYLANYGCVACRRMRTLDYCRRERQAAEAKGGSGKTFIGRLCNGGHEHGKTGGSLRYFSNLGCVICQRQHSKRQGSYVGKLCVRGHEHENSGGSLRQAMTHKCLECVREQDYLKRKPAPVRPIVSEAKTRSCLGALCKGEKMFLSAGPGNRICPKCKSWTERWNVRVHSQVMKGAVI